VRLACHVWADEDDVDRALEVLVGSGALAPGRA
jgi:selenocysteine lyase/cysteine desulfurase